MPPGLPPRRGGQATATFIFIDDETTFLTDTEEQIAEAKDAMREAGLAEAEVWSGDPDDEHSESVLTGQILFAD